MDNSEQNQENSTSKKSFFIPKNIIILIILLLILIPTSLFLKLNTKEEIKTQTKKPIIKVSPSPRPDPKADNFKTYVNTKFGFEFKYPAKGVIQKEKETAEGECGDSIKENADGILVDNFFQIKIMDWQGTIDDYLIQIGARNKYELETIEASNADEAIKVISIKKGLELSSIGFPPLMYVSNIYKKDTNLFIIMHKTHPPEPINLNGCLNPKDLDFTKYPQYANQIWDVAASFKFFPKAKASITPPQSERVCTMEAMQCPDGSYVSRIGPNCEFAPCPGSLCKNIDINPRELTFEASYCNGDLCSSAKTKTECISKDVAKTTNGKISAGQDGISDCSWINNSCQPNK